MMFTTEEETENKTEWDVYEKKRKEKAKQQKFYEKIIQSSDVFLSCLNLWPILIWKLSQRASD